MKFRKIFFDEINSTNTYLIENYKKYDNLTVVISKKQNSGRGQKNNIWESEIGGLYFSILLKPDKINSLTSLITGLSVLETLKNFSNKEFKIKWPNDILVNNKKISGILVESKLQNNKVEYLIIGVGININQNKLPINATSLKNIENKEFTISEILNYFLEIFYKNMIKNTDEIVEKINNNLFGKNNCFDILINNNNIIKAKILSINKEGHLLVDFDSKIIEIVSGKIIIH